MSLLIDTDKPTDFISSDDSYLSTNTYTKRCYTNVIKSSKKKRKTKRLSFSANKDKWKHVQSKVKLYIQECKEKDAMANKLRSNQNSCLTPRTQASSASFLSTYTLKTPKRYLREIEELRDQVKSLSENNFQLSQQLVEAQVKIDYFCHRTMCPATFSKAELNSYTSPVDVKYVKSSTPTKCECDEANENVTDQFASSSFLYGLNGKRGVNESSICSADVIDSHLIQSPIQNYHKYPNISGRKSNRISLGIMEPISEENKPETLLSCPQTLPRVKKEKKQIFSDCKFRRMLWRNKKKERTSSMDMHKNSRTDLEKLVESIHSDQKLVISQLFDLHEKMNMVLKKI